jgi:hypothetical protein
MLKCRLIRSKFAVANSRSPPAVPFRPLWSEDLSGFDSAGSAIASSVLAWLWVDPRPLPPSLGGQLVSRASEILVFSAMNLTPAASRKSMQVMRELWPKVGEGVPADRGLRDAAGALLTQAVEAKVSGSFLASQ